MNADLVLGTIMCIVLYGGAGLITAMTGEEKFSLDDFETTMFGMFWPVVWVFFLFIRWPFKFVRFMYRGFRDRFKKRIKRTKRSEPVEVK